jgi:hypothetical protein
MSNNLEKSEIELINDIYNEILNQNFGFIKTHRLENEFKVSKYLIDIFWEFEVSGKTFSTFIEIKRNPNIELIRNLKSVVSDFSNNSIFIIVSNSNVNKIIKDFSNKNNIYLYESIFYSKIEDGLKNIILNMTLFIPKTRLRNINMDMDWIKEERQKLNIPENEPIPFNISGKTNEIKLFNNKGDFYTTFYDVAQSLFPSGTEEFQPTLKTKNFDEDIFFYTNVEKFPKVKIKSITFEIWKEKVNDTIEIKGYGIVPFILKKAFEKL